MSSADFKDALSLTKRLHGEISELSLGQEVNKKLKSMAADTNKLLVKIRRQVAEDALVATTREQIIRQALKDELIDRDANAAVIAERQRLVAEKSAGIGQLAQRSDDAVQQISTSIASMCPWQLGLSASVKLIFDAQHERRHSTTDATEQQ